jgi:hypothetical protein
MLPNDISRCGGVGSYEEGWREGCEDCARRTDISDDETVYQWILPPEIIAFWCQFHIAPNV